MNNIACRKPINTMKKRKYILQGFPKIFTRLGCRWSTSNTIIVRSADTFTSVSETGVLAIVNGEAN